MPSNILFIGHLTIASPVLLLTTSSSNGASCICIFILNQHPKDLIEFFLSTTYNHSSSFIVPNENKVSTKNRSQLPINSKCQEIREFKIVDFFC